VGLIEREPCHSFTRRIRKTIPEEPEMMDESSLL